MYSGEIYIIKNNTILKGFIITYYLNN